MYLTNPTKSELGSKKKDLKKVWNRQQWIFAILWDTAVTLKCGRGHEKLYGRMGTAQRVLPHHAKFAINHTDSVREKSVATPVNVLLSHWNRLRLPAQHQDLRSDLNREAGLGSRTCSPLFQVSTAVSLGSVFVTVPHSCWKSKLRSAQVALHWRGLRLLGI